MGDNEAHATLNDTTHHILSFPSLLLLQSSALLFFALVFAGLGAHCFGRTIRAISTSQA